MVSRLFRLTRYRKHAFLLAALGTCCLAALALPLTRSSPTGGQGSVKDASGSGPPAAKDPPTVFECRWTEGPIKIDGKADEEAWKHAQVIDHFYLPWLGKNARKARTAT